MRVVYDTAFFEKLKKLNVRIRKSVKEKMLLFSVNPFDPQLDNHELKEEFEGYRSIDITADYRAVYEKRLIGREMVAYFIAIGTHPELYEKKADEN